MTDEPTRIIMPTSSSTSSKTADQPSSDNQTDNLGGADVSDDALMREARLQRNLKILIGVMTALMFAGLVAVAIRILAMPGSKSSSSGASHVVTLADGDPMTVELPDNSSIKGITLDGNRMAIHHQSPSGTTITVIDVRRGERIRDVKITGAVPND